MFFQKTEALELDKFYEVFKQNYRSGKLDEMFRLLQVNTMLNKGDYNFSVDIIKWVFTLTTHYINNYDEMETVTYELKDISQVIDSNYDTYYDDVELESDMWMEDILVFAAQKWYFIKSYTNWRYSFLDRKLVICNYDEEQAIEEFVSEHLK